MKKEFIVLSTEDIKPYSNNPRSNREAVRYVVESIKQTGNLDPIEIDENNVILSGHTRLLALQELGITETECVRYTGLTETQKKKYRLLANKTGEIALWDLELLEIELQDIDFDDFDFGFIQNYLTDRTQELNDGKEIDLENFSDDKFNCKCPKCGFRFNLEDNTDV